MREIVWSFLSGEHQSVAVYRTYGWRVQEFLWMGNWGKADSSGNPTLDGSPVLGTWPKVGRQAPVPGNCGLLTCVEHSGPPLSTAMVQLSSEANWGYPGVWRPRFKS